MDTLGRHALSCKRSEGRYQWHAAIKGIVQQVMMSAHIPSRLEPTGLMRLDGKRPDGVTLAPWKSGCLLVWDATCLDILAALYRVHPTSMPGKVERKSRKYQDIRVFLQATCLHPSLLLRLWERLAQESLAFPEELGHRIKGETGEPRSTSSCSHQEVQS